MTAKDAEMRSRFLSPVASSAHLNDRKLRHRPCVQVPFAATNHRLRIFDVAGMRHYFHDFVSFFQ